MNDLREKLTSWGAVLSAFMMSSCCLGPLILIPLGLSGLAGTLATIIANQSTTFTVTGLECCPPSVIVDLISKVTGVSKVDIESLGNKGKVTVSFDDQKNRCKANPIFGYKIWVCVIGG
ncbi:hypothetical protein QP794_24160 [Paenibacillus sp. UMB7766-LJ446]|uniref:hypothetical protein n=1 Tax=Paenibacillus sp. UMB7766-LJ446 TaxID=3046313 RepID=UPI00254ABFC1|nr:hypothetical protein [Paenibacillus sp. UMB7766-LJ446]MDK8193186.1 hypothetical protein [Paenibacillus sp. UMB7766-LJ446]